MFAVEIFIAYSHNDLRHKDELKKFLRPLLNTGRARVWDDYDIEAGSDWEAVIKKRLYGADIILLLVSPDSLASDYFYGKEVAVSLERHEKGEAVVIPIILRPCAWTMTPLGQLESLPEKGRPVTKYELQDEAFTDIAHRLGDIVQQIGEHRRKATERENQYRSFEAVAHTADHLFQKGEWATARQSYVEAMQLYLPDFSPTIETMRQRIAECDKQEQQLLVQQAFEHRLAEFSEQMRHAEWLFKNENWREARVVYGELIKSHETGFPGEPSEFRKRQIECDQGIKEQERLAKEAKERLDSYQKQLLDAHLHMRRRAYVKALQAARTALMLIPDDSEALRMIREAEAGLVRQPEERRAARKRTFINTGAIAVICFVITIAGWSWIQQREAERARIAFEQAMAENKVHVWRGFIAKFPSDARVQQAQNSIKSIGRKVDTLISGAQFYLDDGRKERDYHARQTLYNHARILLDSALILDSSNSEAAKKLRTILNN